MLEDVPPRPPMASEGDAAQAPPERLGGALAAIYFCAVAILLFPVIGLGGLAVASGRSELALMIGGTLAGPRHLLVAVLPVLVLIVWAGTFVTMTTVRSRSGRTVASVLFVAWGVTSIASQVALQVLLLEGGPNLRTLGPILPSFAATLVSVAAFSGYMIEGERPRRWFSGA
jgi:hypothetical protein